MTKRIVMLAGKGDSTTILFHALDQAFGLENIILEEDVPLRIFLSRRVKQLGLLTVIGQVLFKLTIVPWLKHRSRERLDEIYRAHGFSTQSIPDERVVRVRSANDKQTIATLKSLKPDVVVINGTRILSQRVLSSIPATFVNMHAGITPLYRGVHGAYWALVQQRPDVAGVTVHVVDPGIDTGGILKQAIIEPTKRDTFVTYPFLQLATGIPLLKEALREILSGSLSLKSNPPGDSALWSHPTMWGYLWHRFRKGVK